MDRRGFLGILASLPIIAGFKKVRPEEEEHFKTVAIKRNTDATNVTWDNEKHRWLDKNDVIVPEITNGSGVIPHYTGTPITACSGVFYLS